MIEKTSEGVILTIHVQPKAAKTEYVGIHGDALKFRVAAPPVEGEANTALCGHLSNIFSVAKSAVTICSGQGSRRKRIKLVGVPLERIYRVLNLVKP